MPVRHPACTGLLVLALLLPAADASRLRAQQKAAPPPSGAPRALVAEAGHDFGPVEPGGRYTHTFTLRNAGTAPLTISRIEFSEPGIRSRFKSPLLPGETAPVTIEWEIDRAAGDLDAHAVIHVSDPARPRITYALRGVVRRSVELRPSPDMFVHTYADQEATRSVRIVNNDERPLAIRSVMASGDRVRAELLPVEAGRTYDVKVTVPAGLEPGRYLESIEVETDHPRLASLHLDVNIVVRKDLFVTPDAVDFGALALRGRTPVSPALWSQSLTLKKRDGDFTIVGIDSDVAGLRVEHSPRGRSQTFGLLLSVDPERLDGATNLDGAIRIRTDDADFPEIVVPVSGTLR
jgi:hypothetical protein